MEIKFNNSLEDFDYIIGFDLASYKTGACIYSLSSNKFIEFTELVVSKNTLTKNYDLFIILKDWLQKSLDRYSGKFFIVKEACPLQNGQFSTINTLQSLTQAHGTLEIVAELLHIPFYDYKGIHSTSVKAFFRTPENSKPQKEDIKNKILELYSEVPDNITDNISDAMGVVHVLLYKKWNQDIEEEIKRNKKEKKNLQRQEAIEKRDHIIKQLMLIKRR